MNEQINNFAGEYRWLSNFWHSPVSLDGVVYPSVEHGYQAAKSTDPEIRQKFLLANTCSIAKKIGKKIELRPDWENIKLSVMEDLVRQKFHNPELKQLLVETGDVELIEGNWWNDTFWGVCKGIGENNLGKILMKIRNEIKNNPNNKVSG